MAAAPIEQVLCAAPDSQRRNAAAHDSKALIGLFFKATGRRVRSTANRAAQRRRASAVIADDT